MTGDATDEPRVIYICHPFASDPPRHQGTVRSICRRVVLEGHLPLAPQIMLPAFLEETGERDRALRLCLRLVALADEVRVYGVPTEGMRLEVAEARRLGIPVLAGDKGAGMAITREPPR